MRAFCICFLLFLPYGAGAAVSVSEVVWMGSGDSANHEWIELHNDGTSVDVSGWSLNDGMNLNIELSGTIPANSYVVLERTSEASAPGTAFLIYTGALVNTGATLRLLRKDGSLEDQISGGENWINIGGDNTTKETAQYTEKGWKTAKATPGYGLVWSQELEEDKTEPPADENPKTSSPVTVKKSDNSSESVRLILPDVTLSLIVDAQKIGYVHQPIKFTVESSGIGETLIDSLSYQWNFGDGSVSIKKDTQNVFLYPGTYVVTVYGGFKRQEQVARHEITILPVKVSLTTNREGDVQVNSDTQYELDISGYRIRGEEEFSFPQYSILLPNQTITIPRYKIGKTKSRMVGFYDTENTLVASLVPNTFTVSGIHSKEEFINENQPPSFSLQSATTKTNKFSFISPPDTKDEFKLEEGFIPVASSATSAQLANVVAAVPESNSRLGYLALAGVLALGILGVYAASRRNEMS